MSWWNGKKISEAWITEFEQWMQFRFPDDYRACVLENDGAYAVGKEVYKTASGEERIINSLLSFDKDGLGSIWDLPEFFSEEIERRYVIFAGDGFGNYICFDRRDCSVVFIDHETGEVDYVAPSFSAFVDMLYGYED